MKTRNQKTKAMSILLTIVMLVGLLPMSVFAATYTVQAECDNFWGTVSGAGEYEEGGSVTLTAAPVEDTKFEYWLDTSVPLSDNPTEEELKAAIVSYDATYTFTASENVSLKAVFSVPVTLGIMPMLITGTDAESLFAAEWWDTDYDFGFVTPGSEQIVLPDEIVNDIVTIGDKQYQFKGIIMFGYDEATDTETVELKEAMTIGTMPLYGSEEYWDWFTPISDGIYAAYMEYVSEDEPDEPQEPDTPDEPDEPQEPDIPDEPDEPQEPDTPDEPDEPQEPDIPDEPDEPQEPDTPDEPDEPQEPNTPDEPDEPQTPNNPQNPTVPKQPDNPQVPTSPQTDDNSNILVWFILLFISGSAIIALSVVGRKRRTTVNR